MSYYVSSANTNPFGYGRPRFSSEERLARAIKLKKLCAERDYFICEATRMKNALKVCQKNLKSAKTEAMREPIREDISMFEEYLEMIEERVKFYETAVFFWSILFFFIYNTKKNDFFYIEVIVRKTTKKRPATYVCLLTFAYLRLPTYVCLLTMSSPIVKNGAYVLTNTDLEEAINRADDEAKYRPPTNGVSTLSNKNIQQQLDNLKIELIMLKLVVGYVREKHTRPSELIRYEIRGNKRVRPNEGN